MTTCSRSSAVLRFMSSSIPPKEQRGSTDVSHAELLMPTMLNRLQGKFMRYPLVALTIAMASTVSAQTATKRSPTQAPTPLPQAALAPVVAPPVEAVWEKEPDAFLGVKFNEPFNLAPCPTKSYGQTGTIDFEAMKLLDGVCLDTTDWRYKYQKLESGTYRLAHLPILGFGYAVSVDTKGGLVSSITIDLKQSNFGTLLTAFKDRYGSPTSVQSNTVKTNAGAEFDAANVAWKGKKLSIRMYERMSKVDESYVVISDNAIMEAEIAAQRVKRAAEVQKF